ncbi:MAG: hypothetical protein J0I33_04735 [Microbacterium ginsengisoli]|jgi:hypothetical protein|uniref:hypothetical protein n=1 Tax=Microbacterium TaxID=33882 RepID=UPI0006FAD0E6|nr:MULTISPECIES: hypothetical protein [unclassified Microbacterium]MBN9197929.1 hypothetical protein [Microbacterium ginsengisoli]KQR91603.1 hypothetical protein ASF93_06705 [Microbacterium sp. Leaf347]KQR91759.1 hypothetical protein ASG00_04655 [Microbacterium sp. Leaf351]ODU77603.1 MAG: hypothetical protein ABT08_06230 [Microbacterium sp. SCN 71-21]OJU79188.1 MAG: hypothetical protein BGO15_09615 [Microbacterium sp. 71-23]
MSETPHKRAAFEAPARLAQPTPYDPGMPRPGATVAGALLVLLRAIGGIVVLVSLVLDWPEVLATLEGASDAGSLAAESGVLLTVALVSGGFFVVVDLVLALFIYLGRNWARVLVLIVSTISIVSAFVSWWAQGQQLTLDGSLTTLALDILVLLALSSRAAAAYARRTERR